MTPLNGEEHEQRTRLPLRATLDPAEVAAATERLIASHETAPARLLNGEAVTTLFAARREDLTAVLGAHAFHEAMHALAAAVMRLKSPFHCGGAPNEVALRAPLATSRRHKSARRKALNCTRLKPRESRQKHGLRTLLSLSTPVESAVDNRPGGSAVKPCATGVPAAKTGSGKAAESARKRPVYREIKAVSRLWISAENGG